MLSATAAAAQSAQQSGEFQVGDRIALVLEGPLAMQDTVVVREGLVLRLPNMGDISLKGVRRADAQTYLTQEIGKFVKDPVVRATPLIRIGVLGAVVRPGYYSVPSDALLSDVMMLAGGPASNSDINRSVIRRNDKPGLDSKRVQEAMAAGLTVDQVPLYTGDQLVIGEKSNRTNTFMQWSGIIVGVAGLAIALSR